MKTKFIIVVCVLVMSITVTGQLNIQTGYDFGLLLSPKPTPPFSLDSRWENAHRFNLNSEYTFRNRILITLNTGFDVQNIDFKSRRVSENNYGGVDINEGEIIARIQNYRIGFSVGYDIKINEKSSIIVKLSYDQYFINKITVYESTASFKRFHVPEDQINNTQPETTIETFHDSYNSESIGYPNMFRRDNNHIYLSLEYRYNFTHFNVNPFFGYSPFIKRIFPVSDNLNYFLFGFRLGYEIPLSKEKTKQHE